jgi:hypothetical protein
MIHALLGQDHVAHQQAHAVTPDLHAGKHDCGVLVVVAAKQVTPEDVGMGVRNSQLPRAISGKVYWERSQDCTFKSLRTALFGFAGPVSRVRREIITAGRP